jgi:hypothetical protein
MKFKDFFPSYLMHALMLLLFSCYIIWALNNSLLLEYGRRIPLEIYLLEIIYNALLMMVLSLAFLKTFHSRKKKWTLIFIAICFIVISELLQLIITMSFIDLTKGSSVYYMEFISGLLLFLGFYFVHKYIQFNSEYDFKTAP